MKIGFLTNYLVKLGMKSLDKVAAWAIQNGFEDLEVGPTLPLDDTAYAKVLEQGDIAISALIYCRNYLSSDETEAALHRAELIKRIEFAAAHGIPKVITSTGIDKRVEEGVYDNYDSIRKRPERSLLQVAEVFKPIIAKAEEKNVKICFENCPVMGNIAISPSMWRKLFALLDSDKVGLAYDPSHLVWQMIDPYAYIGEFKDRIFHVHAKDTQIHREILRETGVLTDFSWWSYRVPGRGEIDWSRLIRELASNGYDGTISIEHEDHDYEGDLEQVKEGLLLGKSHLIKAIEEAKG